MSVGAPRFSRAAASSAGGPPESTKVELPSRTTAGGPLGRYLQFADDPLVSSDIVRSPYSCIFDSELTMAKGRMAKVFGWYDNEWGYSCRLVDLIALIGETLPVEAAAATA